MAAAAQEACHTLAEFAKPTPSGGWSKVRDAAHLAGLVMAAVSAAQAAVKAVNATAVAALKVRATVAYAARCTHCAQQKRNNLCVVFLRFFPFVPVLFIIQRMHQRRLGASTVRVRSFLPALLMRLQATAVTTSTDLISSIAHAAEATGSLNNTTASPTQSLLPPAAAPTRLFSIDACPCRREP